MIILNNEVTTMSYNIRFKVKVEGLDKYVDLGYCDANITWNVGKIIRLSTGLPWHNEDNNGYVKDIIPLIKNGIHELINSPEKYKPYESPNGWGTIKGTISFFSRIIECYENLRKYEGDEIADIATFWIE
jgi:hypothetical protein